MLHKPTGEDKRRKDLKTIGHDTPYGLFVNLPRDDLNKKKGVTPPYGGGSFSIQIPRCLENFQRSYH
jgi:hypothetical protein